MCGVERARSGQQSVMREKSEKGVGVCEKRSKQKQIMFRDIE